MKKRITTSITHHQIRILLLRATSLILRVIHLVAEITLIIINEMLKQKLIRLMLMRIIDALIKNIFIIIEIERFIFERIEIIRSLDYSILDLLIDNY